MANTPNYGLYKPDRADTTVEVDTSLANNFTTIDTKIKANEDGLASHESSTTAHDSANITHSSGSVKDELDSLDTRVTDIETNGVGGGTIPDDLNNRLVAVETTNDTQDDRITDVENNVNGMLAPTTFDELANQTFNYDTLRFGYVDNKLTPINTELDDHASQLAERAIQLNHYAKGDGTDETTAIRQAFSDAMTQGRPINLGTAINTFAMTQSIVIDQPLTIIANGTKSTLEQLSWGVPCLEIRSPDVTIIGRLKIVNNQPRTYITIMNPLNNSMVQSELGGFPREACSAVYCQNTFDRFYMEYLDVYGFAWGLHLGTTNPSNTSFSENVTIGTAYGNTVDCVVLGNGFRNMTIESLKGVNITQTQQNPEHVIYLTQRSQNSNGLRIGSIFCDGIQTQGSHIASIKTVDNFHIGTIHGINCGTALTTIMSSGYVEYIQNDGTTKGNSVNNNDIFIQTSGEVVINNMKITSMATYQDASNIGYAVMVTGGASAKINNAKITMASTTPSYAFYTAQTGTIEVNKPSITYNNTQTYAAFYVNTPSPGNTIINDPELIGGSLLIYNTGGLYELKFDPNKIRNGVVDGTVTLTAGTFNNIFTAFQKTPFLLASSQTQPTLRSCNAMKTNNTGAITITLFKYGTNGQEFYLLAGDAFTTIQNNASIVLKGGANLTLTNGQVTKFVWWNGIAYQMM